MRNIGDIGAMSMSEYNKLNPGLEEYCQADIECADVTPTTNLIESTEASRVYTQFSWG